MPSTYSSSLRLELQATGENANTWGTKTNNNLNLLQQAIAGYTQITLTSASATYALDITDGAASDGRNAFIKFVGTVASAISITVPDVAKGYWVKNSATGSALTFRTSSGTGFTLPTNEWVFAIADGASVVNSTPTSLVGYAKLSSTQIFTGGNTFASTVDIKGAVSVSSTLVVNKAATFRSNVDVSGTLTVKASAVPGNSSLYYNGLDLGFGQATDQAQILFYSSGTNLDGSIIRTAVGNFLQVEDTSRVVLYAPTITLEGAIGVIGAAAFNANVSVSGVVVAGPGTSSAPSYSTTNDTNTGIMFPAADTVAVITSATERMRVDASGNVRIGTRALATNATEGFLYIPTCPGLPTGVPSVSVTGLVPIIYNTSNNRLYVFSSAEWRPT